MFTFRIDESVEVTRQAVVSFLSKHVGAHCVVREISDVVKKPHFQGWVCTDMSIQVLRGRLLKEFPSVDGRGSGQRKQRGGGAYSIATVKKVEEYKRYVCKGTKENPPDVVSLQTAIGEVVDVHVLWVAYWKQNESSETEKGESLHIVDKAIEHFTNYQWSEVDDMDQKRYKIIQWMYRNCGKKKSLNTYMFKGFVNAVCKETCPEFEEVFCNLVFNSL